MLVEDDEALRRLGRVMLEQYGYTVLPAGDGAAAMELAGAHPDPIELLMTDILMPGMGGIELAARLSKLRPQLEAEAVSGRSRDRAICRSPTRWKISPARCANCSTHLSDRAVRAALV